MFDKTGKHKAAKRAIEMLLNDIDISEHTEIYNIQFVGEGYRLLNSKKLKEVLPLNGKKYK